MTTNLVWILLLTLPLFALRGRAQIPRVCAQNATQVNATCCPPNPDDPAAGPCGGTKRGSCASVQIVVNGSRSIPTGPVSPVSDNRIDWPLHLFRNVCVCSFFYTGYACQDTKSGANTVAPWLVFIPGASSRTARVRKNALDLNSTERQRFRDVLVRSKEVQSEYVILNDTSEVNKDGSKKVTYFNVSVYDFYVFLNYYATKGVSFDQIDETVNQEDDKELDDFAHKGPNFVPWHRTLLASFERDLNVIANSMQTTAAPGAKPEPFVIPYWDWAGQTNCLVCDDSLVGAVNRSDPEGRLSSKSPFSNWRTLCEVEGETGHPCDPETDRPLLRRSFSTSPLFQTLPSVTDVEFTLNATNYDVPPYNESSNSSSFRNLLEGYIGADNNITAAKLGKRFMGAQVQNYLHGTWSDLSLGPNDPVFWLHYAYLDNIFDMWQQANTKPDALQMPKDLTRAGHTTEDNLVGFFPQETAYQALKFATTFFGYKYMMSNTSLLSTASIAKSAFGIPTTRSFSASYIIFLSVIGCLGLVVIGAIVLKKSRKRREYFRYVDSIGFEDPCSSTDVNEKTRLLVKRQK